MVYLSQDSATGLFPRVENASISALLLQNQTTKKDTSMSVTDSTPNNVSYYTLNVDLSGYEDGLYDYLIVDASNNVAAQGILQIGNYVRDVNTYQIEKNIIVYNG